MHPILMAMSKGDVTPNAVNWANISVAHGGASGNANQTINGISGGIRIRALVSAGSITGDVNNVTITSSAGHSFSLAEGAFSDAAVMKGTAFNFAANAVAESGTGFAQIEVRNLSDGNALLDAFSVTVT